VSAFAQDDSRNIVCHSERSEEPPHLPLLFAISPQPIFYEFFADRTVV
jgi:hypothetical protein